MLETLVCLNCSKKWKRERTRGRKPSLCVKCIGTEITVPKKTLSIKKSKIAKKAKPIPVQESNKEKVIKSTIFEQDPNFKNKVVSSLHPKPSYSDKLREETKNGSTWKCPGCGKIIELLLPVSDVPLHKCTPNMGTSKVCERIK